MPVVQFVAPLRGYHPAAGSPEVRDENAQLSNAYETDETSAVSVPIHNARLLQAQASDPTCFFERYGFTLIKHKSSVTDWDEDAHDPASQVNTIYADEVQELLSSVLLPGRRFDATNYPGSFIRRGPGTAQNWYGTGIHQDFGMTPDDFESFGNAFGWGKAWRDGFDRDAVVGYGEICFWRTVNMKGPLLHLPLVLCDPDSVSSDDLVRIEAEGVSPRGTSVPQMRLRYSPSHRWYVYPQIESDEVLAFWQFLTFKHEKHRWRTCFHTTVTDPAAPADVETRQSCELRAKIWFTEPVNG